MNPLYNKYRQLRSRIADLENIAGLLSWDQEVYMPSGGATFRAQQIATISGLTHEMASSDELYEVLLALSEDKNLDFRQQRNVKESLRVIVKSRKLTRDFVERYSRTISEAYETWMKARHENNFQVYLPKLAEVIALQQEKATLVGYEGSPYNALLDDYEPGMTVDILRPVFDDVRKGLVPFVEAIRNQQKPDDSFFTGRFAKDPQMQVCRQIATDLNYPWTNGRLDLSEHPFSISFNPQDARITTRINETDLRESIWGTIHEIGHALYELGLPADQYGLPSGAPVSLSIHESQSRLWENMVGKSWPFIQAYFPLLKEFFPDAFGKTDAAQFFAGLNAVTPDLIRINSDEVTYHFHILLRYETELEVIEGKVKPADLEELWNERIKQYLGLDVPDAKSGVLQDIHWSHGSFGYFPTYSLGSFYAAQFFAAAQKAIPGLEDQIGRKEFGPLLQWLRENIHKHGHTYSSEELCQNVTGEGLRFSYFMDYLQQKFGNIYQI